MPYVPHLGKPFFHIYEKYFSDNYSRSNELSDGMSAAWPSGSVEFNLDEARRDTQSPIGDERLSTRPTVDLVCWIHTDP